MMSPTVCAFAYLLRRGATKYPTSTVWIAKAKNANMYTYPSLNVSPALPSEDPPPRNEAARLPKKTGQMILLPTVTGKTLESLVYDIANYDPAIVEPEAIVARGEELGYDLSLSRVSLVVDLAQFTHLA